MMRRIFNNVGKFVSERYGFDVRNELALRSSVIMVLLAGLLKWSIWCFFVIK